MAAHEKELVEDIIPLLKYAQERTGQWVPFQIDRDRDFNKAVHWLTTNKNSPIGEVRSQSVVIEWQTRDGNWTGRVSDPAVRNPQGERIGRIRYRARRKRSQ